MLVPNPNSIEVAWQGDACPAPALLWPMGGRQPQLVRVSDQRALLDGAPRGRFDMDRVTETVFDALCDRERGRPEKLLLKEWTPRIDCGQISLDGWSWGRGQKMFISSAGICRRFSEREVEATDGQVYVLEGKLSTDLAEKYALPMLAQVTFADGFPSQWQQLVSELQLISVGRAAVGRDPGLLSAGALGPSAEPSELNGRPTPGNTRSRRLSAAAKQQPITVQTPSQQPASNRSDKETSAQEGSAAAAVDKRTAPRRRRAATARRGPAVAPTPLQSQPGQGKGEKNQPPLVRELSDTMYDRLKGDLRRRSPRVFLERLPAQTLPATRGARKRQDREAATNKEGQPADKKARRSLSAATGSRSAAPSAGLTAGASSSTNRRISGRWTASKLDNAATTITGGRKNKQKIVSSPLVSPAKPAPKGRKAKPKAFSSPLVSPAKPAPKGRKAKAKVFSSPLASPAKRAPKGRKAKPNIVSSPLASPAKPTPKGRKAKPNIVSSPLASPAKPAPKGRKAKPNIVSSPRVIPLSLARGGRKAKPEPAGYPLVKPGTSDKEDTPKATAEYGAAAATTEEVDGDAASAVREGRSVAVPASNGIPAAEDGKTTCGNEDVLTITKPSRAKKSTTAKKAASTRYNEKREPNGNASGKQPPHKRGQQTKKAPLEQMPSKMEDSSVGESAPPGVVAAWKIPPKKAAPSKRTPAAAARSQPTLSLLGEFQPTAQPGSQRYRLEQMAFLQAQSAATQPDDLFAAGGLLGGGGGGLLGLGDGELMATLTPMAPARGRGHRQAGRTPLQTMTPLTALAAGAAYAVKTPTTATSTISPGNPLNSVHREEGVRYMVNRKKQAAPARQRLRLEAGAQSAFSAGSSSNSPGLEEAARVVGEDAAWLLSDHDPVDEPVDDYFDFDD